MTIPNPELPEQARPIAHAVEAGDFAAALDRYHALAPEWQQLPEVEILAATAAARIGDWPLAATLGLSALDRGRVLDNETIRMRALNLLGALAFERGHLEDAEPQLLEALDLTRRLEDRRMAARILTNLASVAHLQGRVEEALYRYHEAVGLFTSVGDERGLAEAYHNLGLLHRQEGHVAEAQKAVGMAMRYARRLSEPSLLALTHLGAAEVFLEQEEFLQAEGQLQRAEELYAHTGDALGEAELARLRARVELQEGRPEDAHRRAAAAEAVAAQHGCLLLEAECATVSATALQELGRASEAQAKHDQVVDGLKKLRAAPRLERFEREWSGVA